MREERKASRLNMKRAKRGKQLTSNGKQSLERKRTTIKKVKHIAPIKTKRIKQTQNDIKAGKKAESKKKLGRIHKEEKKKARMKGWQGIWEPAKQTEKNQDGIT
eukprot:615577-Heterocapsa_arctica.AAC.1